MEVEIADMRIRAIPRNWVVEHRHVIEAGKHAGQAIWRDQQFFATLHRAALYVLDELPKRRSPKTVRALIRCIEESRDEVIRALSGPSGSAGGAISGNAGVGTEKEIGP